jgi:hypothetical protein
MDDTVVSNLLIFLKLGRIRLQSLIQKNGFDPLRKDMHIQVAHIHRIINGYLVSRS